MLDSDSILKIQLTELNASDYFKSTALDMGFENLGELLQIKIVDLQFIDGFTFRWLEDYMTVLETYMLMDRV